MVLLNRTLETDSDSGPPFCLQVVNGIKSRNTAALEALYDKYSALIYGKLSKELNDPQLIEQICKRVFVRAWYEIEQYEQEKCRLFTWLLQMARQEIALNSSG